MTALPALSHTIWSVTLFLALAALLKWKHRRMVAQRRINRGLKAYAAGPPANQPS